MSRRLLPLAILLFVLGWVSAPATAHQADDDASDLAQAAATQYQAGDFSDFGKGVQQVHLAQGKDQSSMVVSWLTTYVAPTIVRYGTKANQLDRTAASDDVMQYTSFGVTSGYIHHVPLTGLKASTTYFYLIGDEQNPDGAAGIRYFTTLPKVRAGWS
jgi:hypothetical protein